MRSLRLFTFAVPLLSALACNDATSPLSSARQPASPEFSIVSGSGPWTTKTPMPTARATLIAGVINGQLYAMGGFGPSFVYGSPTPTAYEAYDPASDTWTPKASAPTVRALAGAGVINDKLYVVGGCFYSDCRIFYTNTLEVYDPTSNSWATLAPMPTARSQMAVGVIGAKLYVAGGMQQCAPCTPLATLEVYDPSTNTWTTKSPMPTAVTLAAGAVVNGIMYVIGGVSTVGIVATVQAYDPVSDTWSTKASMPTARSWGAAAVANGLVYVMGGMGSAGASAVTTNEAYDPSTGTWTTQADLPTARYGPAAGTINGVVYVVGGANAYTTGAYFGTNEAFTPASVGNATQTITFTSTSPNPPYVGATYSVTASASSGLAVSFTSLTPAACTVAGNMAAFVAVGACTIAADQAGNAAYLAAPEQTQSITIVKQPQTIAFSSAPPNPPYVGATYSVVAAASSGLAVSVTSLTPGTCTVAGTTASFVAAGACTIAADQAGNAAYLAAPEQTQSITIVKQPQTITFTSIAPNQPLIGATYTVTATASSGLAVSITSPTPATCPVVGNTATFVAAGSCTIAADQAGNGTYLAAPEQTQAVTIISAAQATQNLITTIASMGLSNGEVSSLSATLKNITTNNVSAACGKLGAFVNKVNADAQKGDLTMAASSQLLQAANAIMASEGCS